MNLEKIDIVIALYEEKNIDWIFKIPKHFNLYIYNKGNDLPEDFLLNLKTKISNYKIEKIKNVGRETDTYLHHIVNNYNNLGDLTIFSQGDPIEHSPDFVKLLQNYKDFDFCQCLTDRYKQNNISTPIPPTAFLEEDCVKKKHLNKYRCACSLINTKDLYPLLYKDYPMLSNIPVALSKLGIENIDYKDVKKALLSTMKTYDGIIDLLLKKCDITLKYNQGEVPNIYYYCIGACFAIKKERILQHSLESYIKMKNINLTDKVFGYVIERTWMVIFGPIYNKKMLMEDLKISNLL